MTEQPADSKEDFEKALEAKNQGNYVLRLYVAGNTYRSTRAISNIREICQTHLEGRYELEVIDIYQQIDQARNAQIIAVPTLIKSLPLPLRRLVGDLSQAERILVGLDIQPIDNPPDSIESDGG